MNEVKPMIITDMETGDQYTLEFDKESVRFAESRGFDLDDVAKYPLTKVEELFWYAFRKHHKRVDLLKARKLLEGIGTLPEGFIEKLYALYSKPFDAFTEKDENTVPFVKVE